MEYEDDMSKQYAKSETKPSLPAFFPVQRNPSSSTLHDEEDLQDQENEQNCTPRKKTKVSAPAHGASPLFLHARASNPHQKSSPCTGVPLVTGAVQDDPSKPFRRRNVKRIRRLVDSGDSSSDCDETHAAKPAAHTPSSKSPLGPVSMDENDQDMQVEEKTLKQERRDKKRKRSGANGETCLTTRVEEGMTVIPGAAAHINGHEVYDAIKAGAETGSYFAEIRGPRGYLNGEVLNVREGKKDFNGGKAVASTAAWQKALLVAKSVAPPGMQFQRGFMNVRKPGDGLHPGHMDKRKSTLIISVKLNVAGQGEAGGITYRLGDEEVEKAMEHGDVAIYTDVLHHEDLADGITHRVDANPSKEVTNVTFLFESRETVPVEWLNQLKAMAHDYQQPSAPPVPMLEVRAMVMPSGQIQPSEQSMGMHYSNEERSRGGKESIKGRDTRGDEVGLSTGSGHRLLVTGVKRGHEDEVDQEELLRD